MSRRKYFFDHTREPSENIKSTKQDCLCILSRKQFFENLSETVFKARENMMIANTAKDVEDALNAVEMLMISYSNAPYVEGAIAERIQGTINIIQKVRMHDLKRTSLSNSLALLLKDAKTIIEEEKKKEQRIEALQSLFMEMAEHVPEISALVDLDKIFKNLD